MFRSVHQCSPHCWTLYVLLWWCSQCAKITHTQPSNGYYLSSTLLSDPTGVRRGIWLCHLWFKASSLVWCLNIRLFDMLLLFQVSLTGQGFWQISHKDFNCSAERRADIPLKPHQSWALLSALCVLPQAAHAFHDTLAPSSGGYKELQGRICFSLQLTFIFLSTVTMVLFLIGISTSINNSSHGNQTSGSC